jgi:dephospho-CoA kinase
MPVRPPLVLTGPPAEGKSSAARSLAAARARCAVIEVDDLRQLVRSGAAAPWEGDAGST